MIFILRYLVVCKIAIGRLRERTSKKSENSAVPVVSNSKNSLFRGTFKKMTPKIEKFFDRLKGGIQKGGALKRPLDKTSCVRLAYARSLEFLDAAHGASVRPIRITQRVHIARIEPQRTRLSNAGGKRRRREILPVRADVSQGSRRVVAVARSSPGDVEAIAGMDAAKTSHRPSYGTPGLSL